MDLDHTFMVVKS